MVELADGVRTLLKRVVEGLESNGFPVDSVTVITVAAGDFSIKSALSPSFLLLQDAENMLSKIIMRMTILNGFIEVIEAIGGNETKMSNRSSIYDDD